MNHALAVVEKNLKSVVLGKVFTINYTIQSAMEDVSKGKICTLDELRTNR